MLTAIELAVVMADVFRLQSEFPRKPSSAFRQFDGVTPVGAHSGLLGLLALNEESLLEELRVRVALALFGHELLEDTTAPLPFWVTDDPEVEAIIRGMTFDPGVEKYVEMWNRSEEVLLCELFDCTMNLTCVGGKKPERRKKCEDAVRRLIAHIEPRHPKLEIVKMAKAFLPATIK